MGKNLPLQKDEQTILDTVLSGKAKDLNKKDIPYFVAALLKTTSEIAQIALEIIRDDNKLQAEINKYLHESAIKTIDSNDDMTRIILENGTANSEVIRELLRNPKHCHSKRVK